MLARPVGRDQRPWNKGLLDRERAKVPQIEQRPKNRAISEMIGRGCGDSRWYRRRALAHHRLARQLVASALPRTSGSPSEGCLPLLTK